MQHRILVIASSVPSAGRVVLYALTMLALLVIPLEARAALPPWVLDADRVHVLATGLSNGFAYAIVRDETMHGHNVYCVSRGARIGYLVVTAIDANGILLSNGRRLPNRHEPPANVVIATIH